jgi:hypothetical protein
VVALLLLHCFVMHYGGSGKLDKMCRAGRENSTQGIAPASVEKLTRAGTSARKIVRNQNVR